MGDIALSRQLEHQGIRDRRVLEAIASLDRSRFVPEAQRSLAGHDTALPLGHEQTISQPYVVARMTEALALEGTERVLEIGTGSGYQAAVLARLAREVYSVEIIGPLAAKAREALLASDIVGVHQAVEDGRRGWPAAAPFDAIVVTAASEAVPPALLDQLADGGRLVAPLGPSGGTQELVLIYKDPRLAAPRVQRLLPVRFVPLTGEAPS
jgi:protein-L-isoaspartate(D-aspartate) O-methyltransferase